MQIDSDMLKSSSNTWVDYVTAALKPSTYQPQGYASEPQPIIINPRIETIGESETMTTSLAPVVHTAALPPHLRSQVRTWYSRLANHSPDTVAQLAKQHVSAGVQGVRATGEAAVVGSLLGAFHAMNPTGLDMKVPGTSVKVPLDAAGALLGLVAGVAATTAPHGLGSSLHSAGAACAAIYGFRQTNDLVAKLKLQRSGITPGGGASVGSVTISKSSFGGEAGVGWAAGSRFEGEDPILKLARDL